MPCQLGGGLRTRGAHRARPSAGASSASSSARGPCKIRPGARRSAGAFPGKVVLGIDAQQGRVATEGWLNVSEQSALDLARQCAAWPLAALVYTDISRDGMLEGPNLEAMAELAAAVPSRSSPRAASPPWTTSAGWPASAWPAASSAGPCTKAGLISPRSSMEMSGVIGSQQQ